MLRIHLLGPPYLERDGQPVKFAGLPRTWPLWAYLLLHRHHAVDRQTLAFTLWPDDSEPGARANLRRHLHDLQRRLPPAPPGAPWLLVDPRAVQWNPGADSWLDVAEFERLSAATQTLAAAVALYTGDLLQNVYDDWLFYERERLRDLYLSDLARLTLESRARREYPAAVAYARQWLAADPLREDALRQLLAVRYEAGDRNGALQDYDQFAQRLRAELGVDPMPETVAVYEAATSNARLPNETARGEPTPGGGAPAPRLILPFVGRDAELAQLRGWWSRAARGSGGVVLVGGQAGMGKTRLAAELAGQAEREDAHVLRGGTTFAEPAPYQAVVEALRTALPLLAALPLEPIWMAALASLVPELRTRRGAPAAPWPPLAPLDPERERTRLFEALTRGLTSLARPRPLLLILEDLQWAGAATAGLIEFLARRVAHSALLILITYREEETPRTHPLRALRRRLQSEHQLRHLALGPLPREAVESLVARIPGLGPVGAQEMARDFYTRSEGHPFFLGELIRESLEQARAPGADPGAPARSAGPPSGVRPLIAARVARLSPQARALADVAAVVGTAFPVELVREVSGWDEAQVLAGLDELLDQGLVSEVVGRRRADYAFTHSLIQATIYADLPAALATRRHRRLAQVMAEIYADRLEELAGELAWHFDRGAQAEPAAQYYLVAAQHALEVYADAEAARYLARALELTQDPARRFALLALHEGIASRHGDRPAQAAALEQMAALAATLGAEDPICQVLLRRILLQRALGDHAAEAALIAQLEQRAARSGLVRWQAAALQAAGSYQLLLSRYDQATALVQQALERREALEDVPGQVECYALLAEAAALQGQFPAAQRWLHQAEELAGGSRANRSLLVRTLRATAMAATLQVDIDLAYALGQQTLDLCRTIGDRECEADAHARVASAAARLFHIEEARQHYAQAEAIYLALGNRQGQAAVLVNAAMLGANLGQYADAIAASRRAEGLFQALDDMRGQTTSLVNIAEHALRQGDYRTAKEAGARGLDLARTLKSPMLEAYALANLGAAERELGQLEPAIAHMEAGLEIRRTTGQVAVELATDLCDLALAYLRAGRLAAAQQAVDEMLALLAADPTHMTHPQFILWVAAQTYRALGQPEKAHALLAQAYQVLQERAAAIPDPESRATFAQLPYNRDLRAAYTHNEWP
ncbi:MAG TPA: AAA family ATPase [Chloroflexia bacterium]|nr:AAA family ATPase [Chloroflexia bacterium]